MYDDREQNQEIYHGTHRAEQIFLFMGFCGIEFWKEMERMLDVEDSANACVTCVRDFSKF